MLSLKSLLLLGFFSFSPFMLSGKTTEVDVGFKLSKADKEALSQFNREQSAFHVVALDKDKEWAREVGQYAYYFKSEDAPVGKTYYLVSQNWTGADFTPMGLAQFSGDGVLNLKTSEFVPLTVIPFGYVPGQRSSYYLLDEKHRPVAAWSYVPYSHIAKSACGYEMQFELASLDFTTFLVIVKGFEPGEEIKFVSQSGDEKITQKDLCSDTGAMITLVSPAVVGKKGGWCRLSYIGSKGEISMRFPWGNEFGPWSEKKIKEANKAFISESPPTIRQKA